MERSKVIAIVLGVIAACLVIASAAAVPLARHTITKQIKIPPQYPTKGTSAHRVVKETPKLTKLHIPSLNAHVSWTGNLVKPFGKPIVPYVCGLVTPTPDTNSDGEVINTNTGKPIKKDEDKCVSVTVPGIAGGLTCDTCQMAPGMTFYDWKNSSAKYTFDTVAQSTGWSAIPPEGNQVVFSTENGFNTFGQAVLDGSADKILFISKKDVKGNRVYTKDGKVNIGVSGLGCMGRRSSVFSKDGLRLYMAYQDNNGSNDQTLAFQNVAGKIATFTRPPTDSDAYTGEAFSTSDSFTFQLDLTVSHPFGSQASVLGAGVGIIGTVMRTSVHPTNGNRVLASRLERDFDGDSAIAVIEEREGMHITGIIKGSKGPNFGKDFAMGRSVLIANDVVNQKGVAVWFKLNTDTNEWEKKGTINAPDKDKGHFAYSLEMSPDDKYAVISSPVLGLKGGTVYLYQFDKGIVDTVTDEVGYNGTYGTYTAVDHDFTVLTVSANLAEYDKLPLVTQDPKDNTDTASHLYLYSIDRVNGKIFKDAKGRSNNIRQTVGPELVVDPAYGSAVSLERNRNEQSYTIAVPEVVNKNVYIYRAIIE